MLIILVPLISVVTGQGILSTNETNVTPTSTTVAPTTKVTPTSTTVAPTTTVNITTEPDDMECKDKELWCAFNPGCSNEDVKTACPKLCNTCEDTCVDLEEFCQYNPDCEIALVTSQCPKLCGVCDTVSSGGNSTTATPNPPTTTPIPPTTTPIPLCTASCAKEFQRCHNYHNNRKGKTCPEAFNQCRGEINQGHRRLARAGCKKQCTSTDDMLKLKTCDCTASCEKEFQRCHNYHNNRRGKTCPEAFNQCRGEINQGHRRLKKAGCKKQCTSTDDMLKLKTCDESNGDW